MILFVLEIFNHIQIKTLNSFCLFFLILTLKENIHKKINTNTLTSLFYYTYSITYL